MHKENVESLMQAEGLSRSTTLYRYTDKEYLSTNDSGNHVISANPSSPEIVINHYSNGYPVSASELTPGLAFTLGKENRFKAEGKVCVEVRLSDVLEQGGQMFKDQSSGEADSWYLTLPNGGVRVTIV